MRESISAACVNLETKHQWTWHRLLPSRTAIERPNNQATTSLSLESLSYSPSVFLTSIALIITITIIRFWGSIQNLSKEKYVTKVAKLVTEAIMFLQKQNICEVTWKEANFRRGNDSGRFTSFTVLNTEQTTPTSQQEWVRWKFSS